jgi:benzoate transport
MDLKAAFKDAPMTSFQVRAVVICLILIMIDGFDVLVMSFAAPTVSREWGIEPVLLGYLLSAGLFGMAFGSIFLTPVADKIGRRPLTLICLVIISAGMLWSVFSWDTTSLLASRVLAGVGIGGMIANLSVIVAEYSNRKRAGLAMGVYAAGYPIGATVGGFLSGFLIAEFGWRSAFALGAGMTVLMLVVCFFTLPESFEYLIEKRDEKSLPQLNRILGRMGHAPLTELPPAPVQDAASETVVKEVFGARVLSQTVLMWFGYAFLIASFYFANTWTPKLLAEASGDPQTGVTAGVLVSLGGIVGSLGFGLLTSWINPRTLNVLGLLASAVMYVVFASSFNQVGLALIVGIFLGMLTNSGVVGYYTIVPPIYTAKARASGFGWMIGVGRLVSIIAPIVVGYLLAGGLQPQNIFYLFAIPLVLSAVCSFLLGPALRKRDGRDAAAGRPSVAAAR